jgi:predicted transcriptional regulator
MKAAEVKSELIGDWMRPEKASIQVGSTLEEALHRMHKLGIHHLIVMHGKKYAGVLSSENCVGIWDRQTKVQELMRADVPLMDENTEMRQVVKYLLIHRLTALVLKRNGEVCGIITASDLLRLVNHELLAETPGLVQKGKEFLSKPIIQGISNLLGNAGL